MNAPCGLTFTHRIGKSHDSAQKKCAASEKIISEIAKFHFDK